MKSICKNGLSLLTAGMLFSGMLLPVQAAAEDIHVSVDQKEVSLTQLRENNYEVPVFVRLEQTVNLNAIEFGIHVDNQCRFEIITRSDYAELHGEPLGLSMAQASIPGMEGYAWLTWGQTGIYYHDVSNLLLILVKVPETAKAEDIYTISYLEQSPSNENKKHVWYNFGTKTDFVQNGSVSWSDGWIHVTGSETPPEVKPGDINGDGRVDIMDVIILNKAVLGKESLSEPQLLAADVNHNQKPDAADSLLLMKYIVGLITDFSES